MEHATKIPQAFLFFRRIRKLTLFVVFLGIYIVNGYALKLLFPFQRARRQKILAHSARWISRVLCRLIGIRVKLIGDFLQEGAALSVSNHVSYLDLFIVGGVRGYCFVSAAELRRVPVLSAFTRAMECIFVDRGNAENQAPVIEEMIEVLKSGVQVHFFPEAKTTDGLRVYPFRRRLFAAAVSAKVPVQVITLNYLRLDNAPISLANKGEVYWHRQISQLKHLWNFLGYRKVEVEVSGCVLAHDEKSTAEWAKQSHAIVDGAYSLGLHLTKESAFPAGEREKSA